MRLRLFAVILACLLSSPALANVIYDVTIDYSGAGHTATFSFTMEFASAPGGLSMSTADLVNPSGDFSNEKLVVDGVEFSRGQDSNVASLSFVGFPFFLSFDTFEHVTSPTNVDACDQQSTFFIVCNLDTGGVTSTISMEGQAGQVVERSAAVPVAPTLALLGLGLAGLGWSRRKK
jgi:hypothetical protein